MSDLNNPKSFKVKLIPAYNYRTELRVNHNGEEIASHLDGGEPEDNMFGRDYAWVAPLLEKVYALGVQDGMMPEIDAYNKGFKEGYVKCGVKVLKILNKKEILDAT